jgi:hypothetical protein
LATLFIVNSQLSAEIKKAKIHAKVFSLNISADQNCLQGIVQSWSVAQRPKIPVPPSRWK